MSTVEATDFEPLLEYVKQARGFDFTGYKRSTLQRRVQKRMSALGIASYTTYIDHLEVHPDEFPKLFDTVLINVTSFLRDSDAWQKLARDVLPGLVARSGGREEIRVWSAGCASGPETYSIAMLLAEALGPDAYRERVKIYATDADEGALNIARQATYAAQDLEPLEPEWREKYFEQHGSDFVFRNDMRRAIIFGRHDLVQDAPISRLDLLICRNTLIYFNAETQGRILARFQFALKEHGIIFVGKSEMLLSHTRLFAPIDIRSRIFTKLPRAAVGYRMPAPAPAYEEPPVSDRAVLRRAAFDGSPIAHVVLGPDGVLIEANTHARALFRLNATDYGRLFQDLELSYRPVELRSRIEEAKVAQFPVRIPDVEFVIQRGDTRFMDVQITPLFDSARTLLGVSLAFADVSEHHRVKLEFERAGHELETAYEEVQATNEELETTNEELQSTVEELETTNEELQSTNEELETMNEELQSTNEELETMNDELRRTTDELNELNAFTESILTSLRAAVIVVDPNMLVRTWNRTAEEMWGLRTAEVIGKPVMNLDIGFPMELLQATLSECLEAASDHSERSVEAVNRRGRTIGCRVSCTRIATHGGATGGAIIFIEEAQAGRPTTV